MFPQVAALIAERGGRSRGASAKVQSPLESGILIRMCLIADLWGGPIGGVEGELVASRWTVPAQLGPFPGSVDLASGVFTSA